MDSWLTPVAAAVGLALLIGLAVVAWVQRQAAMRWVRGHPRIAGGGAVILAALLLFVQLADSIAEREQLVQVDQRLADALTRGANPELIQVMTWITDLGSYGIAALALLLAAGLLWRQRVADLVFWGGAVAGGVLLNQLLKAFFQRARPETAAALGLNSWSFPSGHSMGAMIAYGALGLLLARNAPQRRQVIIGVSVSILIGLIGVSRLILGAHYLSDVVGGFAAGLAWLTLCSLGYNAWLERGAAAQTAQVPETADGGPATSDQRR